MKKGTSIARWIIGMFIILAAWVGDDGIVAKLLGTAFGLSILPVTWKLVKDKLFDVKKWQSIIIGVFLFFAWGMALPDTDSATNEIPTTTVAIETTVKATNEETTIEQTTVEATTIPETTTEIVTEAPTEAPTEAKKTYDMTVHFLDVGQGLSILVQSDGMNLVYDGGDRQTSSYVVSYLKKQGVKTIDYIISSHYDSDHVYGLIGCLNAFEVKKVIASNYEHDSQTYTKFMSAVASEGLKCQYPKVGTEFSFGTGSFTILSPDTISSDSNANSVAIKLVNGENSFIFTGDADHESERDMIASGIDLECDVLSIGHHGSASSSSAAFLQATIPSFAVISCGTGNSYGHPHEEVMEYLQSMEIELFRNDMQEEITAKSDGKIISWSDEPCNDYTPGEEKEESTTKKKTSNNSDDSSSENDASSSVKVWLPASGEKYHSYNSCGRMNPDKAREVTKEEAENRGYEPCGRCY